MNIVWFNWKDLDNPQAGGAEVVNEELAARLAAAGHTVTFITAGYPGASATAVRRGFSVVRVGSRFTVYLAAARYFRAHRAQLRPDLVIDECNTMPFFAGRYTGVRTVLFFHMLCREIWFYEFPQPLSTLGYLLEPLYLRLLKPKSAVIAVSASTKLDLVRHGFTARSIRVIAEATQLTPVPELRAIAKYPDPTLLSLGAMRSMKRTLHQIAAFELAKAQLPRLKFIVAGDLSGPYGARVQAAIAASPHHHDITVLGRVTPARKAQLMQKSHLLLVTSVKEGWGLVVTEAATQGTPAVVYDVDGLRDSVRHGRTGLVTAPSPQALATATASLLQDPARYEQLRTAAYTWASTLTFDRAYADFAAALKLS
ncbi:MAG TPA: glycosyltransferase family 4 protein [Candidatus Saccharimonadia bacterium]|nr:glycosyltransferase family 4 protein [Candidatus Saccharimonadia bacterium]